MKEHKHAEVLRAIADGKEVERIVNNTYWQLVENVSSFNPLSYPELEWRVKPEPKPDFVRYCYLQWLDGYSSSNFNPSVNVIAIFDSETKTIKSVELIK